MGQAKLERKLNAMFNPIHLEVFNESYMHNVPAGSESHFKVVVVSEQFEGQRLIARHRAINKTLLEELKGGVHALSIHAYTSDEWYLLKTGVPKSPNCIGGERKAAAI